MQVQLPKQARNLIERLLCNVEDRLGTHGGAAEVQVTIPFFALTFIFATLIKCLFH